MRASTRLSASLPLFLGVLVLSACSFGGDPRLERDEAEARLEQIVERTLEELELNATDVLEGNEHCGYPNEKERFTYHGLIAVPDSAAAQSAIGTVRTFWEESAGEWGSEGAFDVTGDAAASTLNLDGIEVYLAVTSDREVLQLKGSTPCYEP